MAKKKTTSKKKVTRKKGTTPAIKSIKKAEKKNEKVVRKKKSMVDSYSQKLIDEIRRHRGTSSEEPIPSNAPAVNKKPHTRKLKFGDPERHKVGRLGPVKPESKAYKSPGTASGPSGAGFNRISKKHLECLKTGIPTVNPPKPFQVKKRREREKITGKPHAFAFEVQERLLWVAAQIRCMTPLKEIVYNFCKRYNLGESQARKYIRDVYEEHKGLISEEDRKLIFFEFRETLREAVRRSLDSGKMVSVEKLMRLLGEIEGIVTPKQLINVDARRQMVQNVKVEDGGIAELTLGKLDDLLEQDANERIDNTKMVKRLPSIPQSGLPGSEETNLVSQPSSYDNTGQTP